MSKSTPMSWPEYMRRTRIHNLYLESAYRLLRAGTHKDDLDAFLAQIREEHPEHEMEPDSVPILRELWKGKGHIPPADPVERMREIRAFLDAQNAKKKVKEAPSSGNSNRDTSKRIVEEEPDIAPS